MALTVLPLHGIIMRIYEHQKPEVTQMQIMQESHHHAWCREPERCFILSFTVFFVLGPNVSLTDLMASMDVALHKSPLVR